MDPLSSHIYATTCDHEEAEQLRSEWLANPRFAHAMNLLAEGFSVIPLCRDGKRPTRKWKPYQTRLATVAELVEWFVQNDFTPAIVCGELSGITVIDCDTHDTCRKWDAEMTSTHMTQTTRRGMHFVYRHSGERNTVRVNGVSGIDRRGEGGYVKAYRDSAFWTRDSVSLLPAL